jgi:hypothetical protein
MGWYGHDSGMACQWGLGTGAWSPLWARRPTFWARGAHFWRLVGSGSPGSHFGHPVPIMALHGLIPSGAHSLAVVPMDEFCGHQPTPCSFVGTGCPFLAQSSISWEPAGLVPKMGSGCPQICTWAWPLPCQPMGTGAQSKKKWGRGGVVPKMGTVVPTWAPSLGVGELMPTDGHCGAHMGTRFGHGRHWCPKMGNMVPKK